MVNVDDPALTHQPSDDQLRDRWLTATQAARRLGVKPETIYAYVSRGRLERTVAPDGRTSLFDVGQVDRLARRGAGPRRPARAALDLPVRTATTTIVDGHLRYRGHDAVSLAATASFEQVAVLLWTGRLPDGPVRWTATEAARTAARRAVAALAPGASAFDVLTAATLATASTEPLRVDLGPASVVRSGATLLATLAGVVGSPAPGRNAADRGDLATQLWPRFSPLPPTSVRVRLLRSALVLLADHELATSTLAARVAASTRADPFAVVGAGLCTASGPHHGSASERVHRLLLDARSRGTVAALADAHRDGEGYPGFGHPLYPDGDPRASHLLRALQVSIGRRAWSVIAEVADNVGVRSELRPNVDFALAALAFGTSMPVDAGAYVFGFARIAGWIAHALEEYAERPLRYRPRAVYDEEGGVRAASR